MTTSNYTALLAFHLLVVWCCTAFVCSAVDLPYIFFHGRLLDDEGYPVRNAHVQFWHTDYHGNYDHPGNPYNGHDLVDDFQYFGTSTTNSDGEFDFTTYLPGIYPLRPIRHIHFKVWLNGYEYLTSQFYFRRDLSFDRMLLLDLDRLPDGNYVTFKTVVIDLGKGGDWRRTPHQTEGPYYPVVDFMEMGNDLTQGIGEYATLFPSFTSSGTWFPTETEDSSLEWNTGQSIISGNAPTNNATTSTNTVGGDLFDSVSLGRTRGFIRRGKDHAVGPPN